MLILGGFFLVTAIANMLIDSTKMIEGFSLVRKGTELSLQTTESLHNTQQLTGVIVKVLREQLPELLNSTGILNQIQPAIEEAFTKVHVDITALQAKITTVATLVNNITPND